MKKDVVLFHKIKAHSRSSVEHVNSHQLDRLRQLVDHARVNVPYYKDLISGQSIESLDDLSSLPLLSKDQLRKAGTDLLSEDDSIPRRYKNTSGGSTGNPITVWQDSNYALEGGATFLMVLEMRMKNPFGFIVLLWGAVRDIYGGKNSVKGHIKDFITNTKIFNSARLTKADIEEFIGFVNRKNPDMILAYAQSIYEIASYVEANNVKVNKQKIIHTGAGQLFPFMREKIEEVFGCKVYNHYGGREFGAVASECKFGDGLHILAYNRIVEILDEKGNTCPPGIEGDVVVTVLDNYTMPLIRYKVGDRAIMGKTAICDCGIVYPKIEKITGRTSNNFVRKEGGFVSGEYLTLTYNHVPGIISFQIRQMTLDLIHIYLIVDDNYMIDTEAVMDSKFKSMFSSDLVVEYKYVESIPRTKTGKHLFTVSELMS